MQTAHFFGQGRLVTHGGRHTTQQSGHFGTGQCVAVDVVHEEQNVFAFVTERFSNGQTGQSHAQTVAWWLVHLAVNHRHFGLFEVLKVHNAGVSHLVVEVVSFTGTLAHTGKHGQAAVCLSDVVDQLHHVHGLAHTGTAEQTNLTAFSERANQVNNLDTSFQQLLRWAQLVIGRSLAVDRHAQLGANRTTLVNRSTQHVHDATQSGFTHRDHDGLCSVLDDHAAAQAVGRTQSNGTDDAVTQLLLNFQRQRRTIHLERVIDFWHLVAWKFHVDHGTNTLNNFPLNACVHICLSHYICSKNKFV